MRTGKYVKLKDELTTSLRESVKGKVRGKGRARTEETRSGMKDRVERYSRTSVSIVTTVSE